MRRQIATFFLTLWLALPAGAEVVDEPFAPEHLWGMEFSTDEGGSFTHASTIGDVDRKNTFNTIPSFGPIPMAYQRRIIQARGRGYRLPVQEDVRLRPPDGFDPGFLYTIPTFLRIREPGSEIMAATPGVEPPTASPVPLPAAGLLLLGAAGGLMLARRSRASRRSARG